MDEHNDPAMIYYAALEKFDRENGQRWEGFLRWLGRSDLQRIITLDGNLCPPVVHVESGEDWGFVAKEEFMIDFFTDLDFVLRRGATRRRCMVVAVARDPSAEEVDSFAQEHFEFAGFDVVDPPFTFSVVLNCGRVPGVLEVAELSAESGLILSRSRAFEIRDELPRRYPKFEHPRCHVWAIWCYTGPA